MAKDFYETLGVSKTATKEEIKKAYYKLAHQYHPHKGGGLANEGKMKEINEAYQTLKDDQKRKQYDQFGSAFQGASGFGGGQGFNGAGADFSDFFRNQGASGVEFDLGDIFGDFFGGGRRSASRQTKGADIEAQVTISFAEAISGTEKKLKLKKNATCDICKGNGAEPGAKIETCSTCDGTGQVVRNVGFGIGFPSTCPQCHGAGKKADKVCHKCSGSGVTEKTEEFTAKIPAGIDDGQAIRISGKGEAGPRGSGAGDLFLRIRVERDPRFVRDGYNIVSKKEISFTQAVLGDKVEIQTVSGPVKLKIPEGTQSGKIFKLSGKGVPHLQGRNRGDHLVQVIVKIPEKLSRKQKDILKDLGL